MLPNMNWNYPTSIWFGHKRANDVANACKELGIKKVLIVTDEALVKLPIVNDIVEPLKNSRIDYEIFSNVKPNPTSKNVEDGVECFKDNGCDGVIAFGGGSALDAGKTIAFMASQKLDLWAFEDIGDNWKKADISDLSPCIAIPTTAGTGSEVGRATVITDEKNHAKKIIFHPKILPSIVILDPNLTYDLPKKITAWTGMDALVHSVEAYISPLYHPMAEGIALKAIKMIKKDLLVAYQEPHNENARANMLVAAMMGATAFQKGLGSIHSLAHTLGGLYDVPHGLANSIILPYALIQNRDVIEQKIVELCGYLELDHSFDSFLDFILKLRDSLDIPNSLKEANIPKGDIKKIAKIAYNDPSTSTNARKMSIKDFEKLYVACYEGDM